MGDAGSAAPTAALGLRALTLSAGTGLLLGLGIAALVILPLRHRPPVATFVATIALGLALQQGALQLFGPAPVQGAPVPFDLLAGVPLLTLLLLGGAAAVMGRTAFGRQLRALADDPEAALLAGVPVRRVLLLAFAGGGALAGLGGHLLAAQTPVGPADGADLMLKAYIVACWGGWGHVGGVALVALLVASGEVALAVWLGQPAALAALYGAVLATLWFRPGGLLGEAGGERA